MAIRKNRSTASRKTAAKSVKRSTTKRVTAKKSIEYTNDFYQVVEFGESFALMNTNGKPAAKVPGISKAKMKQAHDEGKALRG